MRRLALVAAAVVLGLPAIGPARDRIRRPDSPYVELWMGHDEVLTPGDRFTVSFRTDAEGYVMVLRADTDGRITILYPFGPDTNHVRGGVRHQLTTPDRDHSFAVEDYPGQGYLFALAANRPFDYRPLQAAGGGWNYGRLAHRGRIVGDPYRALAGLAAIVVPLEEPFAYDVVSYAVGGQFEYPRFLCYDCHAHAAYPEWDPYASSCPRFRIVAYDDPYDHAVRHYGATRIVYPATETAPVQPRYVMRDRRFGDSYLTHAPVPDSGMSRRRIDPGVTSSRFGGIGAVAAPTGSGAGRDISPPPGMVEPSRLAPPDRRPTLERRDPRRNPADTIPPAR